jgi:hypothetical protein
VKRKDQNDRKDRKDQKDSDAAMPTECQDALWAIEGDPINVAPETLGHISACRMCSEARVLWLAQEDSARAQTDHQAPVGYFDHLPSRVLCKLPAQPARRHSRMPLLISAASFVALLGMVAFWDHLFWRQDKTAPAYFEAVNPPREFQDTFSDPTSFSSLELFSQISDLTPEETNAMMADLKKPEASVQPTETEDD